jgi:Concanavalin A-like lectin/glucanases superfamily
MKSHRIILPSKRIALPLLAAIVLLGAPAANAATYPSTVLADNPVAYYRLEELAGAVTALDSSASGAFPATYNYNGIYPQLGQPGIDTNSIAMLAAQASSVTAGYYADLNPQGPFSFEVWARPTSAPSDGYRCPIGNFGGWGTGYGSGWYVYQTPTPGSTLVFIMAPTGVWISTGYSLFTWYHLVGTYDGTNASFYLNGNLIGTQAAAGYLANPVNSLGIGNRGDGYGGWDGNLDEVAIYTNSLSAARVLAHYQVGTNSFRAPPTPPTVRQDPASTTNYAGHVVQFTVLADGTAPLAYQWYKGASTLPGATTTALSFTCAVPDNGTTYKVVVTNNYGSATSAVATLTVLTGLAIDLQPTSITRTEGSNSTAAFVVVAEGALPFSYQWYKVVGSVTNPIPGATQQTLWLTGLRMADDQSAYYVRVSNPSTATNSDPATLTVQTRTTTVPITGYAKVVMADGPVAYWRLNEPDGTSGAVDAAGSFDGTYNAGAGSFTFGAATGIPHETDPGVSVANGATVNIPYALELNPWGPFTAEGWFRPASIAANGNDYRTAFSSMYNVGGVGPTGWLLYQQGNNTWAWVPYGANWASAFIVDTIDTIVANQWYYIALTYDGSLFTVYVNGVAKGSAPYSGFVQNGNVPSPATGYNYTYSGSGPTVLGWRSDSGFNPFDGIIDDVAFYNKALTAQQVQLHYLDTVRLSITKSANNVVLSWPFGTLQAAPAVTGTYTNVTTATSPYTNAPGGSAMFYRVKVQ